MNALVIFYLYLFFHIFLKLLTVFIFCPVKKGGKRVDLLGSLCNVYDTSEEELKEVMEKANSLIEDILKKKPRMASECNSKSLENIDTGQLQCASFDELVALYALHKISFLPFAFCCRGFDIL